MLLKETLTLLRDCGLSRMAKHFEQWCRNPNNLRKSNVECLHDLALDFAQAKQARRTDQFLLRAGFAPTVALANVWEDPARGLPASTVANLRSCTWVDAGTPLVITGEHGVGKSFLAVALAREAARSRRSVRYRVLSQLLAPLDQAGPDKVERLRRSLCHGPLLVLDHVGEDVISLCGGTFLRELVDERHRLQRATLFVSSRHPTDWVHAFENADTGQAVVTRVLDHALILDLCKPGHAPARKKPMAKHEKPRASGPKREKAAA